MRMLGNTQSIVMWNHPTDGTHFLRAFLPRVH